MGTRPAPSRQMRWEIPTPPHPAARLGVPAGWTQICGHKRDLIRRPVQRALPNPRASGGSSAVGEKRGWVQAGGAEAQGHPPSEVQQLFSLWILEERERGRGLPLPQTQQEPFGEGSGGFRLQQHPLSQQAKVVHPGRALGPLALKWDLGWWTRVQR